MNKSINNSWQNKFIDQAICYDDTYLFHKTLRSIRQMPPLVNAESVKKFNHALAEIQAHQGFILHAGECVEQFNYSSSYVYSTLKVLYTLQYILESNLKKPICLIARMAGQFTKPRTNIYDHTGQMNYRGDLINSIKDRTPNPERMLQAYHASHDIIKAIHKHKSFLQHQFKLKHTSFFLSHEALHLHYEQALTHLCHDQYINLSTHLPWAGYRTNRPTAAHIAYLQTIYNPIAIKMGPENTVEWFNQIVPMLNPENKSGKLIMISRMGQNLNILKSCIESAKKKNYQLIWLVDPMHGNHEQRFGKKIRRVENIMKEIEQTYQIHASLDSHLSGVHLELSHEPIYECMGGNSLPTQQQLEEGYLTLIDPRLNIQQAKEIIRFCVELWK